MVDIEGGGGAAAVLSRFQASGGSGPSFVVNDGDLTTLRATCRFILIVHEFTENLIDKRTYL
jgi:hypothetical protein